MAPERGSDLISFSTTAALAIQEIARDPAGPATNLG